MSAQLSLPVCAIPGCTTPVGEWGLPCDGCRKAFGDMLIETPGAHRMTEAEIAERDGYVHRQYAVARSRGVI